MKYCISDIHGCSKTLAVLLAKLQLTAEDTVYFLGDYVDRGPDSKGVLDIVMAMPNAVCHKGNHEDMMLYALANPENDQANYHWGINGGGAAMASFGGSVPPSYIEFLQGLHLITELPNFYLCHAGIAHKAMETPEEMLLWDRDCDVDLGKTGGRKLICGHTPQTAYEIETRLKTNKVIIDGGCVFGKRHPEYGNLVALRLDDMQVFMQRNID